MKNRFNINESEKTRIRSLHNIKVINEQSNPEDRVTDKNCVGPGTPKLVLDIFKDLTTNYGYECVGQIATISTGHNPFPLSRILLKKSLQGVTLYVFIEEIDWKTLIEVGDISYYAPGFGEGNIDSLYDLDELEEKILDSTI